MRLLLVTMFCLSAIGCNSDLRCRRETALLRAEILDLEDKYYALKSKHGDGTDVINNGEFVSEAYYDGGVIYEGQMTSEGGTVYEGEVYEGDVYEGEVILDGPVSTDQPPTAPNHVNRAAGETNSSQGTAPSNISPQPDPSIGTSGANHQEPLLHSSTIILSGYGVSDSHRESTVTEIIINPNLTRGQDVDGDTGDEGLNVLVQPRTPEGHVKYEIGELTVSLIDPLESAERQRIGLWKFLPEETKLFFADDKQGSRGILLHLPWEQTIPVNENLVLHVRFVTLDGRVLKTSSKIRINAPSPDYSPADIEVAKWTQSDSRWLPNPDQAYPAVGSEAHPPRNRVPAVQASSVRDDGSGPFREANPSASANAQIERPAWRPIR